MVNNIEMESIENNFYTQLKNHYLFSQNALMPYSENNHCKSTEYWRYISFRTMICEMIYQAVNLFPEIEEYTITCTSNSIITTLQLGIYSDNIVAKI